MPYIQKIQQLFFSSHKKTIISVVVLLGIVFFVYRGVVAKNTPASYQTVQVGKGSIISTVTENGNVSGSSQAGVGSPTTGIIQEIYVKNGDTVTQGQNLFTVKSIATAQEIASAYASYLGAQNSLLAAQAKVNSLQSALFVVNQKFVTDRGVNNPTDQQKADPVYIEENANWLQAQADYKNQTTIVAQAQASLTNAWLGYQATQDSVVTAPIAGTVANIALQVGDEITASGGNLSSNTSTTSTTNAVLSIGNYQNPYIKVQASEVDIAQIQPGQKATITLSAFNGKTFVGTVSQVDTVGTIASGVVTYNVYITLVAPPSTIKPGMSATVTIQTARKDDVLVVPSSAVSTSDGSSTVRVLQNGKPVITDVTTGLTSDTQTEITSGLLEGDTVITGVLSPTSQTSSTGTSPFSSQLRFGGGFGAGGGGGGAVRRGN